MRIDFNLLWVEDHQDNVQAYRKKIENLMRREGFRLQVVFVNSVAEATKILSEDIYGDHIDMILMDYDLGAGPKGDEGLRQVKNIFPFKEVVFYSSQADNLADMVANKKIQGVYIAPRDELFPDTVVGVFEELVKKVVDIDHSRGIVMGATSDIDHLVNGCLVSTYDDCSGDTQGQVLQAAFKRLIQIKERFDKNFEEIQGIKHVSDLFGKHAVYTSVDRLNLLRKALKFQGNLSEENDPEIQRYVNEIIPLRNDLAHVRVKTEGFSRKLFDRKGKEFTSDAMKNLRLELLEFQNFFETLFDKVKQKAS
ncbi:MAG: hypothetical protein OEY59_11325 [Deltaproteobacteria bacterium]|nr:hypothetical protein [Deltaproteobacteria bacterium]